MTQSQAIRCVYNILIRDDMYSKNNLKKEARDLVIKCWKEGGATQVYTRKRDAPFAVKAKKNHFGDWEYHLMEEKQIKEEEIRFQPKTYSNAEEEAKASPWWGTKFVPESIRRQKLLLL